MNKLKKSIATALLLSVATVGTINININIDSKKFWAEAEKGELYVNSFNVKEYKLLRKDLTQQMDEYLAGGEPLTYQAVQVYLKTVSKEAGEDSFEREGKKIKGWNLGDVTNDNFFLKVNKRLKTKIYGK